MTLKARIALAVPEQGRKALLPTLLHSRMVVEPRSLCSDKAKPFSL